MSTNNTEVRINQKTLISLSTVVLLLGLTVSTTSTLTALKANQENHKKSIEKLEKKIDYIYERLNKLEDE